MAAFTKTPGGELLQFQGLPYDLNLLKDEKNFILQEKKRRIPYLLSTRSAFTTQLCPKLTWLPIDGAF